MALNDKNIIITPNIGSSSDDPKIVFTGADSTSTADSVSLYALSDGSLSIEGSAGQLFSITNNLTGTIFSVNDVSGLPSLEINSSGLVKIAQYSGNVLLGTNTDDGSNKLQVSGGILADNLTVSGNLTIQGTTTTVNTTELNISDNIITLNSDYTGSTPSENAGIEVERGTLTNASLQWNEGSDYWEISSGGTTGRILTTGDEGIGNGLDADTLDGVQGASYLRSDAADTFSSTLTVTGIVNSTNNLNVDGPNFNVSTTNKSADEYAYRVDRSGTPVGGIRIDGRGTFAAGSTVDGSSIVTGTTITNYSINPRFNATIGFGNDTEILKFNDGTNETRTDYWTNRDGFYIAGDSNVLDNVVLKTGHLNLSQNGYIEGKLGVAGAITAGGSIQATGVFTGLISDTVSGQYTTIAYQFSEGRGWGYNTLDDAVFYNAAGGIIPFLARTTEVVVNESSHNINFRVESDVNTHALFVRASDGNIGIGTASPVSELSVVKNQTADTAIEISNLGTAGATTTASFILSETPGTPMGWFRRYRDGTARTDIGWQTNLTFNSSVNTTPVERMRIDVNGNVGINTISPGKKLHVEGSAQFIDPSPTGQGVVFISDSGSATPVTSGATLRVANNGSSSTFAVIEASSGVANLVFTNTGNLGIGVTNPVDKLHIVQSDQFGIRLERASHDTMGIALIGAQRLSFLNYTDGNREDLVIEKTAGKVGIGTNNPVLGGTSLDQLVVGNGSTSQGIVVLSSATTQGAITFYDSSVAGRILYDHADDSMTFATNGNVERMSITSAGNIGIGITDPTGKFEVHGTNGQLFSVDDSVTGTIFSVNDVSGMPSIEVIDDGTVILAEFSGNVGIGTPSPASKLHVYTGDAGAFTANAAHDDVIIEGSGNTGINIFSPNTSYQYLAFGDPEGANSGYVRYYHGGNQMILRAGGADTLYVNDDRVGIGTASPASKLHVHGTGSDGQEVLEVTSNGNVASGGYHWLTTATAGSQTNTDSTMIMYVGQALSNKNGGYIGFNYQGASSNNSFMTIGGYQSDKLLNITMGGNVGIGITNPSAKLHVVGAIYATGDVTAYYSDIRLKNVEGNIESALDKINKLDGFYYTGNDTARELGFTKEEREVGVSAQQVENVLPEAVSNIPGNEEYKTVKYDRLVPLLIEAIKELTAQNQKLRNRLDDLEGRL